MNLHKRFSPIVLTVFFLLLFPFQALSASQVDAPDWPAVQALLPQEVFSLHCIDEESHEDQSFSVQALSAENIRIDPVFENESTFSATVTMDLQPLLDAYAQQLGTSHHFAGSDQIPLLLTGTPQENGGILWSVETPLPVCVDVYCRNEDRYTVIFLANLSDASWEEAHSSAVAGAILSPDAPPQMDGYRLCGWSTDPDAAFGSETYTVLAQDADEKGIIRLYGIWTQDDETYTLMFDPNGSDILLPEPQSVMPGEVIDLQKLGKDGKKYRLLGWSAQPDGSALSTYTVDAQDAVQGAVTLYAITARRVPSYREEEFIYVQPTDPPAPVQTPQPLQTLSPSEKPAPPVTPKPVPKLPKTGRTASGQCAFLSFGIAALLLPFLRRHAQ